MDEQREIETLGKGIEKILSWQQETSDLYAAVFYN